MSVIILPNQLFEANDLAQNYKKVYLVEHYIHFKLFNYHKLKLILQRATMKNYENYLKQQYKCKVHYYEYYEKIEQIFEQNKNETIHIYDPIDHSILNEFNKLSKKYHVDLQVYDSPNFMCDYDTLIEYNNNKPLRHSSFYKWCREKFNILMDNKGKPIGGQWSYDKNNRQSYPNDFKVNNKITINNSVYVTEAIEYVNFNFKNNFGSTQFYMPINHTDAKKYFKNFLKERLECFGPYQDAVDEKILYGCHSLLSPLINIGLLNPMYIINETIEYYKKYNIKLESVEGFIRQLFWREYVMYVYMFYDNEFTSNFFGHNNKLSEDWYIGNTQIKPIDDLIKKVKKYGYLHHIERLMYTGNFMLLSKIDPNEVYKWFMSFFIDAFPWVMKPNVFGMSQFSTGPFMMNRPYFSSSNYIHKMSSYKKRKNFYPAITINDKPYEWFDIWNALYHKFIDDNKNYLKKNYSTAGVISSWNKKNKSDKKQILNLADDYLKFYV